MALLTETEQAVPTRFYRLAIATLKSRRDEALRAALESRSDAIGVLERMGHSVRRPGIDSGGEYDWYHALAAPEKLRLTTNGYVVDDPFALAPDEIDGAPYDLHTIDGTLQFWLRQTRIIRAVNMLKQGWICKPSTLGGFTVDQLVTSPYRLSELFSPEGIIYLAEVLYDEHLDDIDRPECYDIVPDDLDELELAPF